MVGTSDSEGKILMVFVPSGRAGGEVGWGVSFDRGEEDDQLQLGRGRRLAHKVQPNKCQNKQA